MTRTPTEAEPGEAEVRCVHEPYQGRCAHCDMPFVNGKPAALRSTNPAADRSSESERMAAILDKQAKRPRLTPDRSTPNAVDETRYWILLHEPGCVPERKGPFGGDMAKTIREFIEARPTAYIDVLTIDSFGVPEVAHGPEMLQMLDGRSMSTGRKHNEQTRAAHAPYHSPATAVDDDAEWLRDGLPLTAGVTEEDQQRIDAIADRLQSLQASVRVKDEALREAATNALILIETADFADTGGIDDAEVAKCLRAALSDQQGGE